MLIIFIAKATNPIFLKLKYPAHVPNITALHDAQFTMVTVVGRNQPPPPPLPPLGKEDILKAVGIRVKNAEPINGGYAAYFSTVKRSIYHRKSFPQAWINSLWHYIDNKVAHYSNLLKKAVLSFSIFAKKHKLIF